MTALTESIETSITQVFTVLPDPRNTRNQRHLLLDIITIAVIAVLCGCDDWLEVAAYGQARENWFRQFLRLPGGIPSVDTFRRVFRFLDHRAFEKCFVSWTDKICELTQGRIVSIDGKQLRGTREVSGSVQPICIVSAFSAENSMVLGQLATEAKSNEITAIPVLLEMLDIKGAIITIDAAGCQKTIIKTVTDNGGDYVIGLKGNQQTLHDEAENFFTQALEAGLDYVNVDHYRTEEKSRDRYEVREVYAVEDLEWLGVKNEWNGLRSLVMVRSHRTVGGKTTSEDRFYISSLPASAEQMCRAVRSHWGVENKLHWVLDVAYREDLCKTRKDHGAQNFSALRRMTANLIRQHREKHKKVRGGIKCRRKIAAWDDSYLQELLACN